MQSQTANYLLAAVDYRNRPLSRDKQAVGDFANARRLNSGALRRWETALSGGDYPLMSVSAKDAVGMPGVYTWRGKADCPNMLINTTSKPVNITSLTVPGKSVAVHPGPTNGVAVEWVSPIQGYVRISGKVVDGDPNGGDGIAWAIDHQSSFGVSAVASGDFPNGGAQEFSQGKNASNLNTILVSPGDRLQLVILPKADYICDTTIVQLDIKQQDGSSPLDWDLTQDLMSEPIRSNPRSDIYGHPDVWRFSDMADIHREDRLPGRNGELLMAFARSAATAKNRSELEAAALTVQKSFEAMDPHSPFHPAADELNLLPPPAQADIKAALAQVDEIKKSAPSPVGIANGIQEGGIPDSPTAGFHDVRVHIRGRYDRLGDPAPRHFPIILAGNNQAPITSGSGRLELARWLVSDSHPLTARVIVNRIWQHHFGEGIVRTPSNFGLLGERPTHPELLDWLASCFKRKPAAAGAAPGSQDYSCNWSIKKMQRIIMLSSTYQQSSTGDSAAEKADPDNRLVGRFNRQRLEAEAIRDTLLAVSGKLDRTMGGVSTRDFSSPRRTLYIMSVRSDRSGYAPLFDTADPTSSVDRRVISTVAPQALFLNEQLICGNTGEGAGRTSKD